MSTVIAKLVLEVAADVFRLRQQGRLVAIALGLDEPDQIRLATALSEIGREAVMHNGSTTAIFQLDDAGALSITLEDFPRDAIEKKTNTSGVNAAKKLVDALEVLEGKSVLTVTLILRRFASATNSKPDVHSLQSALSGGSQVRPLDELRLENRDLIATLEGLQAQREQLAQLNEELEETNRGVVALYAELDDKTQQLKEASDSKNRFLASVSHELRSPVTSILGLSQLLLDPSNGALEDDQRMQIKLAQGSAKDLLSLVNELLDLAKAESGRLEPESAPVDLEELFTQLRGSLRPFVQPGVTLSVELANLPQIETDRILLAQILRNLLTNALKFTEAGEVRLYCRDSPSYDAEIYVTDTGIGIAPEHQDRVFEEFYQVRGPLQIKHKGTGLGLPYVRRVTRALGGELSLESEPGKGTAFTLRLPLRPQPLLSVDHSPLKALEDGQEINTVLIIDDDERFRTILRGMLQNIASRVIEASGGIEGIDSMRSAQPDLVFVDLHMPDMGGADVYAAMMADHELRDIPIVLISSADLDTVPKAVAGSVVALLSKMNIDRHIISSIIAKVPK